MTDSGASEVITACDGMTRKLVNAQIEANSKFATNQRTCSQNLNTAEASRRTLEMQNQELQGRILAADATINSKAPFLFSINAHAISPYPMLSVHRGRSKPS